MSAGRSHVFRYALEDAPRPGEVVTLGPQDARHLHRVVRRGVGDDIELFDGSGRIWPGEVVQVERGVRVLVGEARQAPADAPLRLCLGLLDSSRLDLAVEKLTELGVARCTVFGAQRARRAADGAAFDRRRERLERVVVAASRQCGRARFMSVDGLVPFASIVAETAAGTGIIVDPRGERPLARALGEHSVHPPSLTVAVGSEAGFADEELELARRAGWRICGLGPTTMRSETAAIVAATLACAVLGHLDGAV